MNIKQLSLSKFFKRKDGGQSESEFDSDDVSEYVPSKQKSLFDYPMSWTRVKEVSTLVNQRITIFDVDADLKQDKALKQIRKGSNPGLGTIVFDPDEHNHQRDLLTMSNYRLNDETLLKYAKMASTIRLRISQKVSQLNEEQKDPEVEDNIELNYIKKQKHLQEYPKDEVDLHIARNPSHPCRKRKSLRQLDSTTRLKVVKLAASKLYTCEEIASRFNIKVQAVYHLLKDSKKRKAYFINKKEKELQRAKNETGIVQTISEALATQTRIWNAKQIQIETSKVTKSKVPIRTVHQIMKRKFKFSFRRIKRVSQPGNSERCKVLRHLYARKMFKMYDEGQHIVNVDESWVPVTDFRRRCWNKAGEGNSMSDRPLGHKVNIIVAVSSEGQVWLSQTQCNTDENVMMMFLSKLATVFTSKYGVGWRDQIVIVMDGASYHKSVQTRTCI